MTGPAPRTPTGRELSHRMKTGQDGGIPHGGEIDAFIAAIEDEAATSPAVGLDPEKVRSGGRGYVGGARMSRPPNFREYVDRAAQLYDEEVALREDARAAEADPDGHPLHLARSYFAAAEVARSERLEILRRVGLL